MHVQAYARVRGWGERRRKKGEREVGERETERDKERLWVDECLKFSIGHSRKFGG